MQNLCQAHSLSSFTDNFAEGRNNDKCEDCKSYCEYMEVIDGSLMCKCLNCNKNLEKEFKEDLIEWYGNRFCDCNIFKFYLVLQKGTYPYEYMDDW